MKVLIAGYSTRALAQSAVAAGYDVVSLDYFGDSDQPREAQVFSLARDLGRPLDTGSLAQAAGEMASLVQKVVIESGLENDPRLARVGAPGQRWYNRPEAVAGVRDPRGLRDLLEGTGMRAPEVLLPGEELPGEGHWLLKDARRSGGLGVSDWDGKRRPKRGEILERFVDGVLASACFVADGADCRLIGMTRQYAGVSSLGARPYAWCGNTAPYPEPGLDAAIERAAGALTRRFGLVGLNGIDFIVTAEGPVLLEVNPRPPASMELFERLLGLNAFQLHVAGCQGVVPARIPRQEAGGCWGKAILYARRPTRINDIRGSDIRGGAAQEIADIPHPGERIPRGAPVCTLLHEADSLQGCWEELLEDARRLYRDLEA